MKLFKDKKEDVMLTATKQIKKGIETFISSLEISDLCVDNPKYSATISRYKNIVEELDLIIKDMETQ